MKRGIVAATLALGVAGTLAAVGQPSQQQPQQRPEAGTGQPASTPAARSDGEFAAMLAEHHTSGIEMARFAAAHAKRDEVRRTADHIRDNQSREQEELEKRALKEGGPAHKIDPQMRQHSQAMVDELHTATAEQIDALFVRHMQMHHQDGTEMIRQSLPHLKDPDLRKMAEKSMNDQLREIEDLRGMQKESGPGRREPR